MLLRVSSIGITLAVSTLLIGAFSTPAHAYLDPGTGSMILQVVLGGVAGAAVAGRFYWNRLLALVGIKSRTNQSETSRKAAASSNRPAE